MSHHVVGNYGFDSRRDLAFLAQTVLMEPEGAERGETLHMLIEALRHRDPEKRHRSREALVAIGKAAVDPLVGLLADKRPHVRWEAATALGQIGDPASAPSLVEALKDDYSSVRWSAAVGLAAMKLKGLMPLLSALVRHPDSIWLREGAHHVCRELISRESIHEAIPLLKALEHPDPEVSVPIAVYDVMRALYSS